MRDDRGLDGDHLLEGWWVRAGAVYGGEEAGAVQGEGEVEVELAVFHGGYAQAGFGGVLEVRAHVCDVEDGGHRGWFWPGMGAPW